MSASSTYVAVPGAGGESAATRPLLTVVVPVYNGGEGILENVAAIRRAVAGQLAEDDVEFVVVSDGSIDGSAERLLEAQSQAVRVLHYDRNLGKGYAVKVGAMAAHGEWIGLVDADLDLDPAALPGYLQAAQREGLDFAIGSKRHPDSVVHYPSSRRVASWCYQLLNRLLFRLDVRDTQVGLKVFSRRVVDDVVPLLLVKQFAFDLELLAVARALGYDRVQEQPIRLDYRFTGSGVGSKAVARALWDTAAIFYRLRVLKTYQRKRGLLGVRSGLARPLVSVVAETSVVETLDYEPLEQAASPEDARGELVALVAPAVRPAGNWISVAAPYFSRADVAAVVAPELAPLSMSVRQRAAAAVLESRLGGGSRRSRYFPGNVRTVTDHPSETIVVRRSDYREALDDGVDAERLVGWLAGRGKLTVYTPDTMVVSAPDPLFRPHLESTTRHAKARGVAARRTRGGSLSGQTAFSLAPAVCAALGLCMLGSGSAGVRQAGATLTGAYAVAVAGSAALGGLRFHSARAGLLAAPALVVTQAAYVAGFMRGLARGR